MKQEESMDKHYSLIHKPHVDIMHYDITIKANRGYHLIFTVYKSQQFLPSLLHRFTVNIVHSFILVSIFVFCCISTYCINDKVESHLTLNQLRGDTQMHLTLPQTISCSIDHKALI